MYQFICVAECTTKILLGLLNSYLDGVKKGDFYQKKELVFSLLYFFILVGYKDFKNFSHINTFRRATLMCMLFL